MIVVDFLSRGRLFDRIECKNCVLREADTAGINVHTTFGEGNNQIA